MALAESYLKALDQAYQLFLQEVANVTVLRDAGVTIELNPMGSITITVTDPCLYVPFLNAARERAVDKRAYGSTLLQAITYIPRA